MRPTVYLDQNIVSYLADNGLNAPFPADLSAHCQCLYSDENLLEVLRADPCHRDSYLRVFDGLSARYLKVQPEVLEYPSDRVEIRRIESREAIVELERNLQGFDDVTATVLAISHKLSGGLPDTDLDALLSEQRRALAQLLDSAIEAANCCGTLSPVLSLLEAKRDELLAQLDHASAESLWRLRDLGADSAGWSTQSRFREAVPVGVVELGNIRPPEVVKQIWSLLQQRGSDFGGGTDDRAFFGLGRNWINPGRPLTRQEMVTAVNTALSTLGYWADRNKDLRAPHKFEASCSDTCHMAIAIFADHFFTMDQRVAIRAAATYEYLGEVTQVHFVDQRGRETDPYLKGQQVGGP